MPLLVVEILGGVACYGFSHALTERVIAVAEGAVTRQVAGCVIAVIDGLRAALALQPVAVGIGAVAVLRGAVLYFFGAVAAQVVTVVDPAEFGFAAPAAGQTVEFVVGIVLVELGIDFIDHAGQSSGGVVAVVAAVGQLGFGIEAQADDRGAAGEVVKAFVRLGVAPGPAVDLAVRLVGDLADDGLAVDAQGGDPVAGPLVVEALSAGAEAAGALPYGVVAVAYSQRGCRCALAFAGEAAMAVVTIADAAGVVADAAQAVDAVGATVPGVVDGLVVVDDLAEAVQAVVAVGGGFAAGVGAGREVAGFVVDGFGDTRVEAGLLFEVAEAICRVSGAEVSGIGDAGDLSEVVVGRIDLAQGAADEAGMRFGDLGQVAVGVVGVGGDGRGCEAGADRLFLAQGNGVDAGAEPAAESRAGVFRATSLFSRTCLSIVQTRLSSAPFSHDYLKNLYMLCNAQFPHTKPY